MVAHPCCTYHRHHHFGGVVVRTGLVFITVGVVSAAIFQHTDAIVMGVFAVVCGLLLLGVKGL